MKTRNSKAIRDGTPPTPLTSPAERTRTLQVENEMSGLARFTYVRSHIVNSEPTAAAEITVCCERVELNASEASHSPKRPDGAP